MDGFYALMYLVPAGIFLLAFWAIWRVIRSFDWPVGVRRTLFVVVGTLGLAPMIAPATIVAVWMPHAVALVLPPGPGYYIQFADLMLVSFAGTASVLSLIAWWQIRADVEPLKQHWSTFAILIVVTMVIVGAYDYFVPDTEIPAELTTNVVESAYADELDGLMSLLEIANPDSKERAIQQLNNTFVADKSVLRVSLQEPGVGDDAYGWAFSYTQERSPPSRSCIGHRVPSQIGLTRCVWDFGTFDRVETLEYRRAFEFSGASLSVTIEFDFDELIDALGM